MPYASRGTRVYAAVLVYTCALHGLSKNEEWVEETLLEIRDGESRWKNEGTRETGGMKN